MSSSLQLLLLVLGLCSTALATCPESDQIHCQVNDRCTRIRYICDGDNDCGDGSDEHSDLCRLWMASSECSRGSATCYRFGTSDCVPISRYCELSDPPCEGDVDPRLCQMLRDEQLQDVNSIVVIEAPNVTGSVGKTDLELSEEYAEEFKAQVDHTIKHEECPHLFTRVGEHCVSVFYAGNVTWGEAHSFCHTIGGELVSFKDYAFFASIVSHLRDRRLTSDFWVGGTRQNDTLPWTWADDTPIELGSPYWGVRHHETCLERVVESHVSNVTRYANHGRCYNYSQAPSDPVSGHCTAINYENYFYMTDEDCLTNKSPLCIHKQKD